MQLHRTKIGLATAATMLAVTSGALAAPPTAGTYRGKTSQAQPIRLKLSWSRNAGKLSGALQYKEICDAAGPLKGHLRSPFSGVKVSKAGRVHVGVNTAGTVNLGNGYTGELTLKRFTSKFHGSRVVGTFAMAMKVTDSQGATVDHCTTRTVHFSARKG